MDPAVAAAGVVSHWQQMLEPPQHPRRNHLVQEFKLATSFLVLETERKYQPLFLMVDNDSWWKKEKKLYNSCSLKKDYQY